MRKMLILCMLAAAYLTLFGVTSAAVIYVPDDYPTIQQAVNNAIPGDEIIVRDGIYTENVVVTKSNLVIRSENGSSKCTVFARNPSEHVILVRANRVVIEGFTITGAWNCSPVCAGILLKNARGCKISSNFVVRNCGGIDLFYSNNNFIVNNTVMMNNQSGIYLERSNNNLITMNKVHSNGINAIEYPSNVGDGIELLESCHNRIVNNTVSNSSHGGIVLKSHSNFNYIAKNTAFGNMMDGIALTSGGSPWLAFNEHNLIIGNNLFENNWNGIYLENYSNNNRIIRNVATRNNESGILIRESNNNLVIKNIADKNYDGISVCNASRNRFVNNSACANAWQGIFMSDARDNFIGANKVSENVYGIVLQESSRNRVINNDVYSNNEVGIWLINSTMTKVIENTVSNNGGEGIKMSSSRGNMIVRNTAELNGYGISASHAYDNIIFLNNFINNSINAFSSASANTWNSTFPITFTYNGSTCTDYMGNYWSDYTGTANPYGIGTTPYIISIGNADYRPLIERWQVYFP